MPELVLFAQRMKEAREKRGLKQKELADAVGVSPQTISAYEKTGKIPTLDNAASIAQVLGVSLDWLCGTIDEQPKGTPIKTLGDVAQFLHALTSSHCASPCENCEPVPQQLFAVCGPGIIFDKDEIGAFLSDDLKMTELLNNKTFEEDFYNRWLEDRIKSLNNITIEAYLKAKYPF